LEETKSALLFDQVKKVVEQSKYEPNVVFDALPDNIPYEKIKDPDDPMLIDWSNKIAHNEGIIQTCTKYTKYRKANHIDNLLTIIKQTHSFDFNKILYLKHPQLFPSFHSTSHKHIANNNKNENDFNIATRNRVAFELKKLARIRKFIDAHPGGINSSLSYTFITKNCNVLLKVIEQFGKEGKLDPGQPLSFYSFVKISSPKNVY